MSDNSAANFDPISDFVEHAVNCIWFSYSKEICDNDNKPVLHTSDAVFI